MEALEGAKRPHRSPWRCPCPACWHSHAAAAAAGARWQRHKAGPPNRCLHHCLQHRSSLMAAACASVQEPRCAATYHPREPPTSVGNQACCTACAQGAMSRSVAATSSRGLGAKQASTPLADRHPPASCRCWPVLRYQRLCSPDRDKAPRLAKGPPEELTRRACCPTICAPTRCVSSQHAPGLHADAHAAPAHCQGTEEA